MTDRTELVQNAAGRMVPTMVNGKPQIPYLGVAKYQPRGRKAAPPVRSSKDYPDTGDKRVPDLETALRKCGLRDGMVISNHHHLRDGDQVALMMLEAAAKIGVKDLLWFPIHLLPEIRHRTVVRSGIITLKAVNGPLGDYCTGQDARTRSSALHGGRWRAIRMASAY
jgi:citrate lyase subunit alpha/citrate CoA-transferase